ncbi:MAG TPA: hypothetical protein VK558_10415 [Patescibacteria group bacterium]|nr:hypothetical protein [Patescibacteria group bacterium]
MRVALFTALATLAVMVAVPASAQTSMGAVVSPQVSQQAAKATTDAIKQQTEAKEAEARDAAAKAAADKQKQMQMPQGSTVMPDAPMPKY